MLDRYSKRTLRIPRAVVFFLTVTLEEPNVTSKERSYKASMYLGSDAKKEKKEKEEKEKVK